MAKVEKWFWYETEYDDPRDVRNAKVRNRIKLRTDVRVNWTTLRTLKPVPQWGDSHPTEPGFYLDFIEPIHRHKRVWELEAEYTVFKGEQFEPNPLSRPTVVTYNATLAEVASLRDAKGFPTVNRAGEFVQGLVRQVPIVDYTFKKNMSADPKWIQTHLGAINSDSVRIRNLVWEPKTLLLASISGGEFVEEAAAKYAEIGWTILADPLGWTSEVWNLGTVQLVEEPREIKGKTKMVWVQVPITEGPNGDPVSEAKPLDEDGQLISEAWQPSRTEPLKKQRLITLKFDMQPVKAFSELPLK
jgi:hypothetical protein